MPRRILNEPSDHLDAIGRALADLAADMQELIAETRALADRTFDVAGNRQHRSMLDQHQRDLRAHRERTEVDGLATRAQRKNEP